MPELPAMVMCNWLGSAIEKQGLLVVRTLLISAVVTAYSAFAGELPIHGVYGTLEACHNFAIGGLEEVASGCRDACSEDTYDSYMLATPTKIIGFEWECDIYGNQCWESGVNVLTLSLIADALVGITPTPRPRNSTPALLTKTQSCDRGPPFGETATCPSLVDLSFPAVVL